ncbi:MAG TPA: response regulator [Terriglobales bacterium]|nr:response regulator [Terriglobales bacterium]
MTDFSYRILVVDDNDEILTVSQAVLATRGYETRAAHDGFEALAIMRKALPDLIICDLSMPNMSGFEFLSIVRRRFPQIPVIATSGQFETANALNWLLADAFIPKVGNPEDTLKRVAELLDAAPIRTNPAKPDKAPVWIPRNGNYFVLTCPDCLRSFSLPIEDANLTGKVVEHECIACSTKFKYILETRR